MKNYDQLIDSALAELESCENLDLLEKVRVKFFGKNGEVTSILKNLSILSDTEKKDVDLKNEKTIFLVIIKFILIPTFQQKLKTCC